MATGSNPRRISFVANHGAIGGGEVMLLAMAQAAADLGREVEVVAPASPADVVDAAVARALPVVRLRVRNGADQLRAMRQWDRSERRGLLWCNGPRPALATAGRPHRVVHLHKLPSRRQRPLIAAGRRNALTTLVPSRFLAAQVPGSEVMWNWSPRMDVTDGRTPADVVTVGFLGRMSEAKGVLDLCEAMRDLQSGAPGRYRLLVAGEARFVDQGEARRVDAALKSVSAEVRGWTQPSEFFSSVDVAAFPARFDESFGLVLTEAMSARCPFVVSDAGAFPEIVGSDYPWIFRRGVAEDLAQLLAKASAADWAPTVKASHLRWETNFSPEAGYERLARLLQRLDTGDGP